jgi:predicted dehydrogenase
MKEIVLIGTGPMALDYTKVLTSLEMKFKVIGRGEESALKFESQTGIKPIVGGVDDFLKINPNQKGVSFIIATGTEVLMPILKEVLLANADSVLIEKPAAISIEQLLENEEFLQPYSEKVFVAYNRRFYASVKETIKLIDEDGGLESMHFEFTEWAHKIEPLQKAEGVKENWFFANSTHVVDLAFFIAGKPKDWRAYSLPGKLSWHPKTKFAGAGITEKGVVFSYNSNWESAGRWGVEFLTSARKIILRPMEEVSVQMKGTVSLEKSELLNGQDIEFKPGLLEQTKAFLGITSTVKLCNLNEHIENSATIYSNILK